MRKARPMKAATSTIPLAPTATVTGEEVTSIITPQAKTPIGEATGTQAKADHRPRHQIKFTQRKQGTQTEGKHEYGRAHQCPQRCLEITPAPFNATDN